ncbi:MAG TPA: hypothetical protein VMW20_07385, partial [Candidatus Nanoarchaeia archaeon]|nr:hypothetical protein [Candidatus Nanoarchaeia archaeon]
AHVSYSGCVPGSSEVVIIVVFNISINRPVPGIYALVGNCIEFDGLTVVDRYIQVVITSLIVVSRSYFRT